MISGLRNSWPTVDAGADGIERSERINCACCSSYLGKEAGILDGDRRLRRQAHRQVLILGAELSGTLLLGEIERP